MFVSKSRLRRWWTWRQRWGSLLLFLGPGLVFFSLFHFYPVGQNIYLSCVQWNILSLRKAKTFVGFANYVYIFKDPVFIKTVINTIVFSVWTVGATVVFGLILATLLLRVCPWIRTTVRTVVFVPVIALTVASAVVWKFMFQINFGLINYLLSFIGLGPYAWLNDFVLALPAVIIMGIWRDIGFTMVLFLAALLQLPQQYYEAADIDGANDAQKWWHITLPLIRPITMFVVVIQIIKSFQVFTQVFVMTRGGPGDATRTIVQYIYETGFVYWNMGAASAMSIFLFGVVLFMTVFQFKYFGEAIRY